MYGVERHFSLRFFIAAVDVFPNCSYLKKFSPNFLKYITVFVKSKVITNC